MERQEHERPIMLKKPYRVVPVEARRQRFRSNPRGTNPPQQISFVEWLDFKMQEYGFNSDLALARALGVSHPTISRWRGGAIPDIAQLRKLAALFHTPLSRILVISGQATPEEMETEPPEIPKDPIAELIESAPISESAKEELMKEWRRRQQREKDLMQFKIMQTDEEDDDVSRLLDVNEDHRYAIARILGQLIEDANDQEEKIRR